MYIIRVGGLIFDSENDNNAYGMVNIYQNTWHILKIGIFIFIALRTSNLWLQVIFIKIQQTLME
jgi:hypothetical protein